MMLRERLCAYELGDHLEMKCTRRSDFGNKHFRDGVESCLRTRLIVGESFHLDPAESLRYLNFEGGQVWDRDTESWVRTRPDMLISRTTRWNFAECNNPGMEMVDKALALVRESQDKRGLHLPSHVPEEAAGLLNSAREVFPELQFWFDLRKSGMVFCMSQHTRRGGCLVF